MAEREPGNSLTPEQRGEKLDELHKVLGEKAIWSVVSDNDIEEMARRAGEEDSKKKRSRWQGFVYKFGGKEKATAKAKKEILEKQNLYANEGDEGKEKWQKITEVRDKKYEESGQDDKDLLEMGDDEKKKFADAVLSGNMAEYGKLMVGGSLKEILDIVGDLKGHADSETAVRAAIEAADIKVSAKRETIGLTTKVHKNEFSKGVESLIVGGGVAGTVVAAYFLGKSTLATGLKFALAGVAPGVAAGLFKYFKAGDEASRNIEEQNRRNALGESTEDIEKKDFLQKQFDVGPDLKKRLEEASLKREMMGIGNAAEVMSGVLESNNAGSIFEVYARLKSRMDLSEEEGRELFKFDTGGGKSIYEQKSELSTVMKRAEKWLADHEAEKDEVLQNEKARRAIEVKMEFLKTSVESKIGKEGSYKKLKKLWEGGKGLAAGILIGGMLGVARDLFGAAADLWPAGSGTGETVDAVSGAAVSAKGGAAVGAKVAELVNEALKDVNLEDVDEDEEPFFTGNLPGSGEFGSDVVGGEGDYSKYYIEGGGFDGDSWIKEVINGGEYSNEAAHRNGQLSNFLDQWQVRHASSEGHKELFGWLLKEDSGIAKEFLARINETYPDAGLLDMDGVVVENVGDPRPPTPNEILNAHNTYVGTDGELHHMRGIQNPGDYLVYPVTVQLPDGREVTLTIFERCANDLVPGHEPAPDYTPYGKVPTETGNETGTGTGTETGNEAGTGFETGTETGNGTGTETGTGTGNETGTGTGTETGTGTGTETGTGTGTETGTGTGNETGTGTETGLEGKDDSLTNQEVKDNNTPLGQNEPLTKQPADGDYSQPNTEGQEVVAGEGGGSGTAVNPETGESMGEGDTVLTPGLGEQKRPPTFSEETNENKTDDATEVDVGDGLGPAPGQGAGDAAGNANQQELNQNPGQTGRSDQELSEVFNNISPEGEGEQ